MDGLSVLGANRFQRICDRATLEQLEALAAHEAIRQSRPWHAAILARLTAEVQEKAVVEQWSLVDWEDYFSKLEV